MDFDSEEVDILSIQTFLTALGSQVNNLGNRIHMVFNDYNLYVDALERLTTEYDNTLRTIFEQAQKASEEYEEKLKKRKESNRLYA